MFTLKHITPYGSESVHESAEVSYTPNAEIIDIPLVNNEGNTEAVWASSGTVWWRAEPSHELVPINNGSVYVMNDAGSTVSRYNLGGWRSVTYKRRPATTGANLESERIAA